MAGSVVNFLGLCLSCSSVAAATEKFFRGRTVRAPSFGLWEHGRWSGLRMSESSDSSRSTAPSSGYSHLSLDCVLATAVPAKLCILNSLELSPAWLTQVSLAAFRFLSRRSAAGFAKLGHFCWLSTVTSQPDLTLAQAVSFFLRGKHV